MSEEGRQLFWLDGVCFVLFINFLIGNSVGAIVVVDVVVVAISQLCS